MKKFLSFVGEQRLIFFADGAETPDHKEQPADTPETGEVVDPKNTDKPVGDAVRAAKGKEAKLTAAGDDTDTQAQRMAAAEGVTLPGAEEGAPEQEVKEPETVRELYQQQLEQLQAVMNDEKASGPARFMAALNYIAKYVAMIKAEVNGELDQPLSKPEEDKPQTPEAGAAAPAASPDQPAAAPEAGAAAPAEKAAEVPADKEANPKKKVEALKAELETLNTNETQLEQQYATIRQQINDLEGKQGADTDAAGRTQIENLEAQKKDISAKLKTIEEQKTSLNGRIEAMTAEQTRREQLVKTEWSGVEKLPNGQALVTNVELGGDGNDLVFTVDGQNSAELLQMLKASGNAEMQGNNVVLKDVDAAFFSPAAVEMRKLVLTAVAKIPKEAPKPATEEAPAPTETKAEIAPAKDSPEGQIRQDIDGNYWQKGKDGWTSYSNSAAGMNSDSGFKGVTWGDGLMDERTKSIVPAPTEQTPAATPDTVAQAPVIPTTPDITPTPKEAAPAPTTEQLFGPDAPVADQAPTDGPILVDPRTGQPMESAPAPDATPAPTPILGATLAAQLPPEPIVIDMPNLTPPQEAAQIDPNAMTGEPRLDPGIA